MKKVYNKPVVLCQELHPETMLCTACYFQNPTYNEAQQCGFTDLDMGFTIFANTWIDCKWPNDLNEFTEMYCYHNSQLTIFGS